MTSAVQRAIRAASRRKPLSLLLVAVAAVIGVLSMHAVAASVARPDVPASSAVAEVVAQPGTSGGAAVAAAQPGNPGIQPEVSLWLAACDTECGSTGAMLVALCAMALLTVVVGFVALARAVLPPPGDGRSPRGWHAVSAPGAVLRRSPLLISLCVSRT